LLFSLGKEVEAGEITSAAMEGWEKLDGYPKTCRDPMRKKVRESY
jgi:hypothetical protein